MPGLPRFPKLQRMPNFQGPGTATEAICCRTRREADRQRRSEVFCTGTWRHSRSVGLTLGRFATFDARGRSPTCNQVACPLSGRGAGSRSPGFPLVGNGAYHWKIAITRRDAPASQRVLPTSHRSPSEYPTSGSRAGRAWWGPRSLETLTGPGPGHRFAGEPRNYLGMAGDIIPQSWAAWSGIRTRLRFRRSAGERVHVVPGRNTP
jgi:hypothetical protein